MIPRDMAATELGAALMRTQMHHEVRAGLELVTAHSRWLARPEFLALVDVTVMAGGVTYAWLDWDRAGQLVDLVQDVEPGEVAILRLACHLAGHCPGVDQAWTLREIVAGLADRHAAAVTAFAWAVTGGAV